ncbi:uncharacterized protein LOC124368779 [Homalodisca vitripennis]|uniref:uncharacterized protein LOC124368779 n=1 Tax=Homalodisca vitripennis TaxID=197043 RepID=UPI001EE9F3F8|nr:uncharacterized protein LOC124368779 [Homalodisca vitripennis]
MKKVMTTEYNAAETSTSSIVRAENIQTAQRQLLQQTTVPPTVDGYHNKTSLVRTSTTLDMELAKNLEAFTLGEFKRSNLEQQTDDIPSNPEKPTMKKVTTTEYNAADTSSSIVQPENIQTTQRQPLQQTTVPPTVGRGRGKLLQKLADFHKKTSSGRTCTTQDMELAKNLEAFTLGEFKRSNLEQQTDDIPSNPEKPTMKKVMITEYNAAETSSSIVQPEIIQTTQRQPLQQTTVPPTVGRGRGKLLQKLAELASIPCTSTAYQDTARDREENRRDLAILPSGISVGTAAKQLPDNSFSTS